MPFFFGRRKGSFMKKMDKRIPKFKNEDEEREFWATHSPLDYFDSKKFKRASFPKLKPSLKSISIRLPEDMLAELKILANKKDVPYQSLAKIYLARQIALERGFINNSQ
jgi:predicted DNA binding CopG/RHH family protein